MSQSRGSRVLRGLLSAAILLSAAGLEAQEGRDFTVRLKSRTFTPARGVEASLREESRAARRPTVGLIQLEEAPDEAVRAQLQEQGVELLAYVPDNTWMARLPADLDRVTAVAGVRWIGRLLPEDKMAPELANKAVGTGKEKLTLDVEAFQGSFEEAVQRIEALGGLVLGKDEVASTLRVLLSRDAARSLAASDAVQWVAPEPPRTVFNNRSRINTRANQVQAVPYGLNGSGVQLGIWDGGEIHPHIDFASRLTMIDLWPGPPTPPPPSDHATHVTGTMAGDGTNSVAFGYPALHFRGYSTAADIIGYDFNGTPPSEHNAAINTYGIDNSQNSWGFAIDQATYNNCALFGDYPAYSREYDRIVTGLYTRRIPVVFAAGNDRNDGDCGMSAVAPFINYNVIAPPSTAKNVITVGAINGDNDTMTDFSNWGSTDDGRIKPDLVAPGDNATATPLASIVSTWIGVNNYAGIVGTSMAAPAVSGTIGLLLERYRDVCPTSPADPLPSTLKALLIHTARDLDTATSYLNPGPDYASGYGAMDTKAAVDMLPFFREDQVGNAQTDTYQILVTQQKDLKVTLVWDDVAALANAAVTLVNNLDLELVDPNNVVYRPWILNPAVPANNATTGVDNRNVVEQVVVPTVTAANAGIWTIRVIGTSVPSGPQSYSLVSEHLQISDLSCDGGSTAADAWIMDKDTPLTPVDTGAEPNPDNTAMWISNQIWVRNSADDLLPHQNPDFGQDNYVYARIRNNGTADLNTVRVRLYYANASAGLAWPQDWHLIGDSTVVNLPAGQSVIIDELPWSPPSTGHYCLYARLITDQDPMTFAEGVDVNTNTRNNNNIAWRNVNVADILPNSEGGVEVLFGNVIAGTAQLNLNFDLLSNRRGVTLLDYARIQVRIGSDLQAYLREQGITLQYEGFEQLDDLTFRMTSPTAFFSPITVSGRRKFNIGISFDRFATPPADVDLILDFNQNSLPLSGRRAQKLVVPTPKPGDPNTGGVRYELNMP